MGILSDEDCRRIEGVIARIEGRSAAECVVAVIPRSGTYPRGRALIAASWALAAAVGYFQFVPWGSEVVALLLEVPVFALVWALLGVPRVHALLVPRAEAESTVRGAAFRMFAEHGVHRTRGRTGILLLVSELERRAVLLGDTAIQDRVGTAGFARHIDHLVGRIREGRAADGIIEVLDGLESSLVADFPVAEGDENELPNRVLREP